MAMALEMAEAMAREGRAMVQTAPGEAVATAPGWGQGERAAATVVRAARAGMATEATAMAAVMEAAVVAMAPRPGVTAVAVA